MDYLDGEDHTIDRPAEYAFWRDYVPKLTPAWPGKLLGPMATQPGHSQRSARSEFDPTARARASGSTGGSSTPATSVPGIYAGGITLVNWPQNDYWLGNLIGVSPEEAANSTSRRPSNLSLSLLTGCRPRCPRPDGGTGWKGLRLRPDIVGTDDGLAKHPYIRESRRIKAEFTVPEKHVGTDARRKALGRAGRRPPSPSPTSVGVGSYRIDLHPSSGGDNYIDVSSLPFQIPLGALIPRRVENLLPACKNLGVTHVTNGCYRLHPVEWAIGEAAGALASYCLAKKITPRAVRNTPAQLKAFQAMLVGQGVEIDWPKVSPR